MTPIMRRECIAPAIICLVLLFATVHCLRTDCDIEAGRQWFSHRFFSLSRAAFWRQFISVPLVKVRRAPGMMEAARMHKGTSSLGNRHVYLGISYEWSIDRPG